MNSATCTDGEWGITDDVSILNVIGQDTSITGPVHPNGDIICNEYVLFDLK